MPKIELERTFCPVCGPSAGEQEVYSARFDPDSLNSRTFSARRLPDGQHFRIVRCLQCRLMRSDPIVPPSVLETLYSQSSMQYAEEIPHLRKTYGRYLAELPRNGSRSQTLLEIGCGSGFFLEEAREQGFDVWGIEPSADAQEWAVSQIRPRIVSGAFRSNVFPAESFDVIAAFQVLDHLPDPLATLQECRRLLRNGGILLMLHHNASAFSARLLGQRSPIIDIEHLFFYTPATMRALCERAGLEVVRVRSAINWISVAHLIELVPLPLSMKSRLLATPRRIGRFAVPLPIGNLVAVVRKSSG